MLPVRARRGPSDRGQEDGRGLEFAASQWGLVGGGERGDQPPIHLPSPLKYLHLSHSPWVLGVWASGYTYLRAMLENSIILLCNENGTNENSNETVPGS